MGCIVISHYYVSTHIIHHYYYLEALEQAADVDGPQHGVDIQAATIRGQRRQSEDTRVMGVKTLIIQYYVVLLYIMTCFTLDCASHETCFPPGVRHERAECRILLVYIRARSFYINLVGSLGSLATAVDQAAPQHDFRC